eukprot:scaffold386_cov174-Ochromonas_danica.AAC.16
MMRSSSCWRLLLSLFPAATITLNGHNRNTAYRYGPLGHLTVSKFLWKEVVQIGDIVIDATCGNGHDSLFLANLALQNPSKGELHCMDIQESAILSTKKLLEEELSKTSSDLLQQVYFHCQSHEHFPPSLLPQTVSLIVYNLGYLPGSDKSIKTVTQSTLQSIERACDLVREGGMVSVTAYPGHAGGEEEYREVERYLSTLPSSSWRVYEHRPLNRERSPVLIGAYRIDKSTPSGRIT